MKAIAIVVGVIASVCLLDLLGHLMLGVGFLYLPADANAQENLLTARFFAGAMLAYLGAFVWFNFARD